jgi:hypothetical protein
MRGGWTSIPAVAVLVAGRLKIGLGDRAEESARGGDRRLRRGVAG